MWCEDRCASWMQHSHSCCLMGFFPFLFQSELFCWTGGDSGCRCQKTHHKFLTSSLVTWSMNHPCVLRMSRSDKEGVWAIWSRHTRSWRCKKLRVGRMNSWSDLVWNIHGSFLLNTSDWLQYMVKHACPLKPKTFQKGIWFSSFDCLFSLVLLKSINKHLFYLMHYSRRWFPIPCFSIWISHLHFVR